MCIFYISFLMKYICIIFLVLSFYFQSDNHKIDALSGGIVIYTSHCTQTISANQVFYDYV